MGEEMSQEKEKTMKTIFSAVQFPIDQQVQPGGTLWDITKVQWGTIKKDTNCEFDSDRNRLIFLNDGTYIAYASLSYRWDYEAVLSGYTHIMFRINSQLNQEGLGDGAEWVLSGKCAEKILLT